MAIRDWIKNAVVVNRTFTRWQAAGIHLFASVVIAALVLTVMVAVWYPPPLFEADGGSGLLTILVAVDVTIGPLVTLVIFKAGKPGLKFDLWVIGVLQVCALIYGAYIVFEVRPAFIVFVKDQFAIVNAIDLTAQDLRSARRPEFRSMSLTGPVLVAVEPPTDADERQAVLFSALAGGKDMQHYPRYYVPYAEAANAVLARGRTLEQLRRNEPDVAQVIERYLAEAGRNEADVLYLPMRTRRGYIAALVNAKTGELVKTLITAGLR
jgi:hypothetical protein